MHQMISKCGLPIRQFLQNKHLVGSGCLQVRQASPDECLNAGVS